MIRISNVKLPLDYNEADLLKIACQKLKLDKSSVKAVHIFKKSVDARDKGNISYVLTLDVEVNVNETKLLKKNPKLTLSNVPHYEMPTKKQFAKRPLVVGFGPAGMFAALILAEAGACPIVVERGECVEDREKSVNSFWQKRVLDENSNIQFGEGGAGTFSDGKLNTGIKDPRIRMVLETFVKYGAPEEILYEAKPHIGTDKLPKTVANIRKRIIELGGEVRFNTKLVGLDIKEDKVVGARLLGLKNKEESSVETDDVIIAIGHSARDTFKLIDSLGFPMEKKPFAVGMRIEHPAELISRSQYGESYKKLPNADYKLAVHLPNGRGVYSFCMCPGGTVVGATSFSEHVVTNGMSKFARDDENSNAAILVGLNPEDFDGKPLFAGFEFQEKLEKAAFVLGGSDYSAPAQTLGDFMAKRKTESFGSVKPSYQPGVVGANLDEIFPSFITDSIREAMPLFARKIKGYDLPDAVLTAPESRSSCPVRILRGESLESIRFKGVYPAGEGAGYAGGITSAAVDGIKVAEKIISKY